MFHGVSGDVLLSSNSLQARQFPKSQSQIQPCDFRNFPRPRHPSLQAVAQKLFRSSLSKVECRDSLEGPTCLHPVVWFLRNIPSWWPTLGSTLSTVDQSGWGERYRGQYELRLVLLAFAMYIYIYICICVCVDIEICTCIEICIRIYTLRSCSCEDIVSFTKP